MLKNEYRNGAAVPAEMDDHPVSQYVSDFWDGGDPWGSAMAEGFALCDFVNFYLGAPEEIPMDLGYRSAMGGADRDSPLWEALTEGYEGGFFTADDAFSYLPILNRYLDACKAAGLDY